MVGLRSICIVAAAGGLLFSTAQVADAGVRRGDRAAELVGVKDRHNHRVKIRQYRGKILVVTFGASWCPPCKKELPALEKIARSYSKDRRIQFLAVNIDKNKSKGKRFVKRAGLRAVRVGFDPKGSSVRAYDPPNMPTTYIIGKRGVVRHMHKGFHSGDGAKLRKVIKKMLR